MPTALRDARTVEQAMSGQFAFCFPSTSLAQAARMMAQNRVYELPVIVDQRSLGYVSYLDILQRYVRAQLGARAADIVRTPLPEVRPEAPLAEAVRLLRESGRQVILVTTPAGMPVGALTARDVALAMAAA
ncbi:MAG TPA: CBS domain-containing protein [Candidatus Dormibacteraeota bacterium]|jgi:predicted transcriptional regulator|nr:CBS domain-containing protein [Candidatus Dormibacteraeota bacterium]